MAGPPATEVREKRRKELRAALVAHGREDIEPLRTAIEAAREAGLEEESLQPAEQSLQKLEADMAVLTFMDVPRDELERLQVVTLREEAVAILMRCMHLTLDDGFQAEVLAEFYYHNFMFCQRQGFCAEKTSTFLSILKLVHTRAIVKEGLSEVEARQLFDSLLDRHSHQLPPYSFGVFSTEEATTLREHTNRNFFRLYSMHGFIYTQRQELELRVLERTVVPKVPTVAPLHTSFELDPSEVSELEAELAGNIAGEAADAGSAAGAEGGDHQRQFGSAVQEADCAPEPPAEGGTEADVLKAINEAMEAKLGHLDGRLKLPE